MMNAINMNTVNNAAQNTIITAKDVAKATGYALATVRIALSGRNGNCKPSTMDKIREMAKIMGYNPKLAQRIPKSRSWNVSSSGNFATRIEETNRMLQLRAEGYTNAEIGKKVGLCHATVINRIGCQPAEFTKASTILWAERRVRRNALRRQAVLKTKIAEFENLQKAVELQTAKAYELEREAQRIADEAKFMRCQADNKIVELDKFRKEAEKAANALGVSL